MATKLGTWRSDRYHYSWITQRLLNRAPEHIYARRSPSSLARQVMNPIGVEIESTRRQLVEERNNMFLPTINPFLMDRMWRVDVTPETTFQFTVFKDSEVVYDEPRVYGTIVDTEYELTIAQGNDIESLWYNALPSRIEDAEISYSYQKVIPKTLVNDLGDIEPNEPALKGFLYVTLEDNTTWEYQAGNTFYSPKIYIDGITRKDTRVLEAIPLRYNGTFKSIYQWESVLEVFVSYLDSTASITIDSFDWAADSVLDIQNIMVDSDGDERFRYIKLANYQRGSFFVSESFVTSNWDIVRTGIETKNPQYEIELLDEDSSNIEGVAWAMKPSTDLLFVADVNKLYIYDVRLEYPEVTRMSGESPDVKMDLVSTRWSYAKGQTAKIKTRILDPATVPFKHRWTLETPSLTKYYVGSDNSLWPTTQDAWIQNTGWDFDDWKEQSINLFLDESGTYIITLECEYTEDDFSSSAETRTVKFLIHVPSIQPEVTLPLPAEFVDAIDNIGFDADGKLWASNGDTLSQLNVFYDYFMADYARNAVFLIEQYESVRIVV